MATWLKVYVKSIPSCWWKPSATNLDFTLAIEPSGFFLILNTHLQPTTFWEGCGGTLDQVPSSFREVYSSFKESFQGGDLRAWLTQVGACNLLAWTEADKEYLVE